MRKIFMLCLTGALALATTSCKDEKVTTMQTITVNGRICEVKSAFYTDNPSEYGDEASFNLILFNDVFRNLRQANPLSTSGSSCRNRSTARPST